MLAICERSAQTDGVQCKSDPNREVLDAAALCGHLVPEGSVIRLGIAPPVAVPDELFEDLFPSGRGRPSVPGSAGTWTRVSRWATASVSTSGRRSSTVTSSSRPGAPPKAARRREADRRRVPGRRRAGRTVDAGSPAARAASPCGVHRRHRGDRTTAAPWRARPETGDGARAGWSGAASRRRRPPCPRSVRARCCATATPSPARPTRVGTGVARAWRREPARHGSSRPRPRPTRRPKMGSPSKRGTHSQSIEPSVGHNTAVRVSPISP